MVADSQLLVDGGLTDNLPVAALRSQLPTATIVAVDVTLHLDLPVPGDGLLDLEHFDAIVEVGYEGSQAALAGWVATGAQLRWHRPRSVT